MPTPKNVVIQILNYLQLRPIHTENIPNAGSAIEPIIPSDK